jgi:alpha-1,3-rhamnosyltransferase
MTEQQPLVSIVIPCYNHSQFVQETIQSVIDQDYENIELIIIDDGSKDNSVEVIQEMIPACEERFVRFEFRYRPNKGLCATLNEALEWCEGEYFSPLASDDIALPHKTSFLINKHQQYDAAVVFGSARKFNIEKEGKDLLLNCEHTLKDLMFIKNMPAAPASLMRTDIIRNVGGFLEGIALEDLYMWLKLTSNGEKLYSFPEVVVKYRDHEANTIKRFKFMHEQRMRVLDIFSENSFYKKAKAKSIILGAKAIANEEIKEPLRMVFRYKIYNLDGLKIALKAITPSVIIRFARKIV